MSADAGCLSPVGTQGFGFGISALRFQGCGVEGFQVQGLGMKTWGFRLSHSHQAGKVARRLGGLGTCSGFRMLV